ELEHLTQILFCRRFNPLDYWQPDPIDVQSQDWETWLDALEQRFRFLAADGITVLRGGAQNVSYQQILLQVCRYLKIPYSRDMSATDLEAEIFLHLIGKAWKRLPASEKQALTRKIQTVLAQSNLPQPLPVQWQHNPVYLLLKGSSVIAVNSLLKPLILRQVAQQLSLHLATYQAARAAAVRGGAAAASAVQNQLALQTAKQGIALSAARYGAVRTALTLVGPALWAWFLADLGWRAVATNYTRVIPVIFTLAQIRLTRAECWEPI
ncbi:MAG: hypothetical protein HC890_17295, partial [Chloroflexaceae bacterium]|nr:hypothetical protein [Chloroflexaceae bacterium]